MTGVRTNIVTAVEVRADYSHDSKYLVPTLAKTLLVQECRLP